MTRIKYSTHLKFSSIIGFFIVFCLASKESESLDEIAEMVEVFGVLKFTFVNLNTEI